MRTVLANGVFDILHAGHVEHLKAAREMGDRLIVALTDDAYVGKGAGRPVNKWEDRAAVLRACRYVDEVIKTQNAVQAIHDVKPHVFVKGIDYANGDRFTEDVVGACRLQVTELRYTLTPKKSATDIIRKAMTLA